MVTAIIVAAGKGVRMNAAHRKQYLHLGPDPILVRTLRIFSSCSVIDDIILAVPSSDVQYCRQLIEQAPDIKRPCRVIPGGDSRQDSVYLGLLALGSPPHRNDLVVIHDGVRPLVTPEQIEACVRIAEKTGACILAVPVQDTMKQVDTGSNLISGTVARENIWMAQTPQVFEYGIIRAAHDHALKDGITGTDDAMLVERIGIPVRVAQGSRRNIKITTPEDLLLAEALLASAL